MDHMKDNFGELLAAISGSKDAAAPPSSRRVQPQQNEYQNQHQHQYQQNDYPTQQQQQYVWQAQPMPQQQQQQPMPMPMPQLQQQQQQPYGYGGYVPMSMPPMPISQQQHSNPIMHQQHQYGPGVQQAPSNISKGLEAAKTTKKSFPVVFITISLIVLGFGVLAVWYYSKKNVLADSVPLSLPEESARLPPPKLFLVSEQEETEKLLQDSHVIENLERYLSSPPTTTTTESKPNAKTNSKPVSKNRFTKLSDVIAEEEEEQKPLEEIEVEVNGFKKKMPKRIDSDSPEINDFMKRREQLEKENLKWIESQRLSGSTGSNEEI